MTKFSHKLQVLTYSLKADENKCDASKAKINDFTQPASHKGPTLLGAVLQPTARRLPRLFSNVENHTDVRFFCLNHMPVSLLSNVPNHKH
jgi:hypothetical protein